MNQETQTRTMNILLANDGSEHAFSAINLIKELPLSPDSCIHVLSVLLPRFSPEHDILEHVLEKSKEILSDRKLRVKTEFILGYPQEIIIEYAEEHDLDLIVLGAKGLRATLGILLGGVAQQVVEYSSCPVLVVRAPSESVQKVCLVTDGSNYSRRAIEYLTGRRFGEKSDSRCKRFPLPQDAQIEVIHVLPPMPSPELIARSWPMGTEIVPVYEPDPKAEEEWIRSEKEKGQEILNRTLDHFSACGVEANGTLLWGDAATEILEYTKEHDTDLIVAGSRGLSRMRGWLLGSVSRKLVHYANCSVLIVKADISEE